MPDKNIPYLSFIKYSIIALLSGVLCWPLLGQTAASTDTLGSDQLPSALSPEDIIIESSNLRQILRRSSNRLLGQSQIFEIDSLFQSVEGSFSSHETEYQRFRSTTPNRIKLEAQIGEWNRIVNQREKWLVQIREYLSKAQSVRTELRDQETVWALTGEEAAAQELPASIQEQIADNLQSIGNAQSRVNTQINIMLDLSARMGDQRDRAEDIVYDLREWVNSGELNIWYRRHAPIWNTTFRRTESDSARVLLTSGREMFQQQQEYYVTYRWQTRVFIVFGILLFFLVRYLHVKAAGVTQSVEDRELERSLALVRKQPYVVAGYLTVLGGLFFLGELPDITTQVLMLAFLSLSASLLNSFILPHFKWVVPLLLVAFLLDEIKVYLWFTSANYRLYMYGEAIFGLAALWYVAYPVSKLRNVPRTWINRILFAGIIFLAALNAASIIANTLGFTNLSDLLIRLSVQSSLISLIAYGLIVVVGGIVSTSLSIYFDDSGTFTPEVIQTMRTNTRRIVTWIAGIMWFMFILISAELYRPLFGGLEVWLTSPWTAGNFSITPGNILSFMLVIAATVALTRTIAVLIDAGALGFLDLPTGTLNAISVVIRYFVVALAIAVALGTLGVDLTKLGLLAGALGVGIGFGLQNIVANFIAGLILTFEQPIEPGDTIEINGLWGTVRKIGVRSSVIRAFSGADIVVPNNTLLDSNLVNWTKQDKFRRLELHIGVAYGSNSGQVEKILLDVVRNNPMVESEPPPFVVFDQFGSSSIDFRLFFWIDVDVGFSVKHQVMMAIYDELGKAGIEIPFPKRDVTIINPGGSRGNGPQKSE